MFHVYLWLNWAQEHFLVVFLALAAAVLGGRWLLRIARLPLRALRRVGRKPAASVALVFFLVVTIRLALLPILGVPVPRVHDEFSYLLAADTFASGRLSNPPHPLWVHFETFHVNPLPTYGSMYPPAQGVLLGAFQALSGEPWIGVLLSAAAMCAGICWMLQGWMSGPWALAGGLLAAARYSTDHYWINSYWGGALPALGGALLLGAAPRLVKHARGRDAVIATLGVAILANSRPLEGAVLTLAVVLAVAVALLRRKPSPRLLPMLAPAVLLIFLTAGGMGYYFWRTTGSPFRMPYQVNVERYHTLLPWLGSARLSPMEYRHKEMQTYYTLWAENFWAAPVNSVDSFWKLMRQRADFYHAEFIRPWLVLFLVGLALTAARRKWMVLLPFACFLLPLAAVRWAHAHYAAPVTALVIAFTIWGLRALRLWQRKSQLGLRWSNALLVFAVPALLLANIGEIAEGHRNPPPKEPWHLARVRLARQLEEATGQHLVLVRYGEPHNVHAEWVYNRADIDGAKIVWAREMSPQEDRKLLEYFRGRKIWVLYGDEHPVRLEPYSPDHSIEQSLQDGAPHENDSARNTQATR